MSKTYSNEEVQQILREAIIMQESNDISPEQLVEIAAEVGISAQTLQKAEKVWLERQEKSKKQAKRRKAFIRFHLIPYLAVSVFLVLLNFVTTPRYFWSVYPILGWGLGVTIDGLCAFPVSNKKGKGFLTSL
ncbi:MAG: 2TM domain-containing protein [Chloroflexota bacterium]